MEFRAGRISGADAWLPDGVPTGLHNLYTGMFYRAWTRALNREAPAVIASIERGTEIARGLSACLNAEIEVALEQEKSRQQAALPEDRGAG